MNETTDYEPVITILTYPRQQVRIKDIQRVIVSSEPEISSHSKLPVYEVKIIGIKGKFCKFYSPSIKDRDRNIAELNWYIQARESVDVTPSKFVNRVK